jgi:tRNA A-37 threonylcarbamoyl transferase component Bud32
MLSLRKRRIITSTLKFRHRDTRRVKWWLKDESLIPVARSVVAAIRDITNQTAPSNGGIIKLNERKIVFRIKHPQDAAQSLVAKVFLLNSFARRLKYDRYGLDEAANLIKARDRGINTPVVYGYGHMHDILGFVKVNVVILEDLRGLSSIRVLMCEKSENECPKIFMRTIPLFVRLYRTGCKHIDVNNGNVMLCEHDLDSKVFLIDFQHAKFHSKPSSEILMFEAGYFARSCHDRVPIETINQWLDRIFTAVGIHSSAETQKMRERFNYYFGTYLSRQERIKIH